MIDESLDRAVQVLKSYPNYRLIERYEQPLYYCADDNHKKFRAVFLDVETTGLHMPEAQVIEVGWVIFEYGVDGSIFKILDVGSQYQDPGKAIPDEIVALTGINDEMVKDCRIDTQALFDLISDSNIVIAHNAAFDRPFIESFWEESPKKPWACSMAQVPWKQEGIESAKLEYLAYRFGFFYEGHRASTDCLAGVHLLSKTLPHSKEKVFKVLLQNARRKTFRIWALNAPIEHRDLLKSRRYRWNAAGDGKHKAWFIELAAENLSEELQFLWDEVYPYQAYVLVEELDAKSRFSKQATLIEHWVEKPSDVGAIL